MEPNNLNTTIRLEIHGPLNNLSVASAIYNWYKNYEHINRDVELGAVAELLTIQAESDREREYFDE